MLYILLRGENGYQVRRYVGKRGWTVCFLDTESEWGRFCAALDAGKNEVDAVHAIG
jgi:hypothetical protein